MTDDEPPPIGGSWRALYAAELLLLAACIAAFALMSSAFA